MHRSLLRTPVILLVEDNSDDIYFIKSVFTDRGLNDQLHVAPDGAAALTFLLKEPPHEEAPTPNLIILDLKLPKVSGFTVLDRIKADPELRQIPVVVLTSSDRDEDVARAYDSLVSCLIMKPQDLEAYHQAAEGIINFWLTTAQLPYQR